MRWVITLFFAGALQWVFAGSNILKLDSVQVFPTQTAAINITINNQDPFITFQLDIPLPPGFIYVAGSIALNPARKVDHSIQASVLSGNILRILSFSMTNKLYLGNSGVIAGFTITSGATPGVYLLPANNVEIGSPQATNILTGTINGAVNLMGALGVVPAAVPTAICAGSAVQMNAVVSGGAWFPSLQWTSIPPGFTSTLASPVDYPQQNTLYILSVNDGHQVASGDVQVAVFHKPTVSAGNNILACIGNVITLAGTASNYQSLQWEGGNGIFTDANALSTIYTPSSSDWLAGSITIYLTAYGSTLCPSAISFITVSFVNRPQTDAGNDLFVHAGNSVQITGSSAKFYTSLYWLTSGDGYFNNPTMLHPTYTPGPLDILNGQASLTLTASAFAPCSNVQDKMTLIILKPNDNVLKVQGGTAYLNDTVTISIGIDNKHSFTSCIFELEFPAQMNYLEGSAVLSGRKYDHQLTTGLNGRTLAVQAISPSNSLFSGNQGNVVSFEFLTGSLPGKFPLTLTSAQIVAPDGTNILTAAISGEVSIILTGTDTPAISTNTSVELTTHAVSGTKALKLILSEAATVQIEMFDLSGRRFFVGNPLSYSKGEHLLLFDQMFGGITPKGTGLYLLRVNVIGRASFSKTFKVVKAGL